MSKRSQQQQNLMRIKHSQTKLFRLHDSVSREKLVVASMFGRLLEAGVWDFKTHRWMIDRLSAMSVERFVSSGFIPSRLHKKEKRETSHFAGLLEKLKQLRGT